MLSISCDDKLLKPRLTKHGRGHSLKINLLVRFTKLMIAMVMTRMLMLIMMRRIRRMNVMVASYSVGMVMIMCSSAMFDESGD